LGLDVFEEKKFGVVGAAFQYKIVDNPLWIRRGMDFDVSAGLDIPVNGDDDAHQYLKTALAMYYQFKHLGRPTLATRVGMEWHGGDYQFYQGAILGSQENFRGVRKERFVGDRVFYHNTDLRIRISQWRSYYIPASFGIQLNFDHGRVWVDGEDSDTWHYAYGGGFWFSPFQQLLLSINYHKSDIDQRFSVAMGFLF
jgi:hemolysin activation/secretion protein